METIYDVTYFIKKFQAIPEKKWCVSNFAEKREQFFGLIKFDAFCAQGHCGMVSHLRTPEGSALVNLFQIKDARYVTIAEINNGEDKRYQQKTPKKRVLAALNDLKAKQQSEQPKVIYKTVVIDSAVKELQTTLTEN